MGGDGDGGSNRWNLVGEGGRGRGEVERQGRGRVGGEVAGEVGEIWKIEVRGGRGGAVSWREDGRGEELTRMERRVIWAVGGGNIGVCGKGGIRMWEM